MTVAAQESLDWLEGWLLTIDNAPIGTAAKHAALEHIDTIRAALSVTETSKEK